MSKFSLTLLLQILLISPPNPRNFPSIYIFSSLPYLEERGGSAWEIKNRKIFPPYNDIIVPNIETFVSVAIIVTMMEVFHLRVYR